MPTNFRLNIEPNNYISSSNISLIDYDNIKTIIECGACRGEDTGVLAKIFPRAEIFAFEANKDNLTKMLSNPPPNTTIIGKALWNKNEIRTFYETDVLKSDFGPKWKDGNFGTSGLFAANATHRSSIIYQKESQVECVRLDTFFPPEKRIDMLCLDAEGSELQILEGCGDLLKWVRHIFAETTIGEFWVDDKTKLENRRSDIVNFLKESGFIVQGEKDNTEMSIQNLLFTRVLPRGR